MTSLVHKDILSATIKIRSSSGTTRFLRFTFSQKEELLAFVRTFVYLLSDAPARFGDTEALVCVDTEAFMQSGIAPKDIGGAALKYVSEQLPGIAWSLNTAVRRLEGNLSLNV